MLIHMSVEEVQSLLEQMEYYLNILEKELTFLQRLKRSLSLFWEAPTTGDYIISFWSILTAMEEDVETLRANHLKAWREMQEWLKMDGRFPVLFASDADDTHPVSPDDLSQGPIGDCYLVASIAAIALQNPQFIEKHITVNRDGSYSVVFYQDGKPISVIVKAEDFHGLDPHSLDHGELWPLIYEKAYAKLHGGYSKIGKGGWPSTTLEELTGHKSQVYRGNNFQNLTLKTLDHALKEGKAIVVGTLPNTSELGLVGKHAYYVDRVDPEHGIVYLRNPWGWDRGEVKVPFKEFSKALQCVAINPTK